MKIITGDSQIDSKFHQQLLNVEVVSFLVALKNSKKKIILTNTIRIPQQVETELDNCKDLVHLRQIDKVFAEKIMFV